MHYLTLVLTCIPYLFLSKDFPTYAGRRKNSQSSFKRSSDRTLCSRDPTEITDPSVVSPTYSEEWAQQCMHWSRVAHCHHSLLDSWSTAAKSKAYGNSLYMNLNKPFSSESQKITPGDEISLLPIQNKTLQTLALVVFHRRRKPEYLSSSSRKKDLPKPNRHSLSSNGIRNIHSTFEETIVLSFRSGYVENLRSMRICEWCDELSQKASHAHGVHGSYNFTSFGPLNNLLQSAWRLRSKSRIHGGVLDAYESLRSEVHALFREVLRAHETANILITGFCGGGAIAQLAAFDLWYSFPELRRKLLVYTFGVPKMSNKNFLKGYSQLSPQERLQQSARSQKHYGTKNGKQKPILSSLYLHTFNIANSDDPLQEYPSLVGDFSWDHFSHLGQQIRYTVRESPFFMTQPIKVPNEVWKQGSESEAHVDSNASISFNIEKSGKEGRSQCHAREVRRSDFRNQSDERAPNYVETYPYRPKRRSLRHFFHPIQTPFLFLYRFYYFGVHALQCPIDVSSSIAKKKDALSLMIKFPAPYSSACRTDRTTKGYLVNMSTAYRRAELCPPKGNGIKITGKTSSSKSAEVSKPPVYMNNDAHTVLHNVLVRARQLLAAVGSVFHMLVAYLSNLCTERNHESN